MTSHQSYDLVLFGATGFTGQLVATVLRDRLEGTGLRWAIAGRNREKLERLRSELGLLDLPIVVGDALEPIDMRRIAESARVVCSTAGPYARYGSDLVAACAQAGTHYCDLSGEVPWMRRMIEAHDATARRSGARIVPACGFDSLPSDLGVLVLQERVRELFGRPAARIHGGLVRASGGVSGGTVQSALDLFEPSEGHATQIGVGRDPRVLAPGSGTDGASPPERIHPHWDRLARTWTAPWPMSLVNARVVIRSAALQPAVYGREFRYEESMWTGSGPVGAVKATGVALGLLAVAGGLALPPLRRVAERALPKPGEGPSERRRQRGSWEMQFVAVAPSRADRALRMRVAADEDPGYGSTSRMLAECALSLVEGPEDAEGGLLTPAAAFGRSLVGRLGRHAGIRFEAI